MEVIKDVPMSPASDPAILEQPPQSSPPTRLREKDSSGDPQSTQESDPAIYEEELRCGGPTLPALPVETLLTDQAWLANPQSEDLLLRECLGAMSTFGITYQSIDVTRLRTTSHFRNTSPAYTTFLILAPRGEEAADANDDPWLCPLTSILRRFKALGYPHINVEFRDPRVTTRLQVYPILQGHDEDFVDVWESGASKIMLRILKDLAVPWNSLTATRYGTDDAHPNANPIAIIFSIAPHATSPVYRKAKRALVDAWQKHYSEHVQGRVGVVVVRGTNSYF